MSFTLNIMSQKSQLKQLRVCKKDCKHYNLDKRTLLN